MSALWKKSIRNKKAACKLKEHKHTAVPGNSCGQAVERRDKQAEKITHIICVRFRNTGHGARKDFCDDTVIICFKKDAGGVVYEKDPDGGDAESDGDAVFFIHKNNVYLSGD